MATCKNSTTKSRSHIAPTRSSRSTIDPVSAYLQSLAASGREPMRSLLRQAVRVKNFQGELEQFPWEELTYEDVAALKTLLVDANKSASTINTTLAAVRGVLRTAYYMELIPLEQLARIGRVAFVRSGSTKTGRALTKAEVRRLLGACRRDPTPRGARDRAILELILTTGLRRAEVAALETEDLDESTRELNVRKSKGGVRRMVDIPTDTFRRLQSWFACRGEDPGPIFCPVRNGRVLPRKMTTQAIYDVVRRRAIAAQIQPCTPHDLRRTFCTRLLEKNVDLNTVRQLAGHQRIETTIQYDHRDTRARRRIAKQIRAV